jgi:hypothetical protein
VVHISTRFDQSFHDTRANVFTPASSCKRRQLPILGGLIYLHFALFDQMPDKPWRASACCYMQWRSAQLVENSSDVATMLPQQLNNIDSSASFSAASFEGWMECRPPLFVAMKLGHRGSSSEQHLNNLNIRSSASAYKRVDSSRSGLAVGTSKLTRKLFCSFDAKQVGQCPGCC